MNDLVLIRLHPFAASVARFFEPSLRLSCICAALVISFGMMCYCIPNILAISYRKKLYDMPDGRHIHKSPIPRLGGVAFLPIIFCSVILTVSLYAVISPSYDMLSVIKSVIWICPMTIIFMMGVVDDLIGVRPVIKLVVQIIAEMLVVWSGLWIDNLGGLFGIHALPTWVGMPLTVFFVVLVINAMNLIDGIDGLAGGLSIVSFLVYGVHSYLAGSILLPLVAAASLGTLIPFYYTNVRGWGSGRHKLFMGDTGSQSMGLMLSIFAISFAMKGDRIQGGQNLVFALSPLIVPVFDLVHVALFRLAKGKHPFKPDKTHIHHRLMQKGFACSWAMIMILGMSVLYCVVNMALASRVNVSFILLIDLGVWVAFNCGLVSIKNVPLKQQKISPQIPNFNKP